MPKIETYDPGQLGLRPSEVGVEATAGAARRIGASYNQVAAARQNEGARIGSGVQAAGQAAEDFSYHRELSNGVLTDMKLLNGLSAKWNNVINGYTDQDGVVHPKADPRDPSVAQQFMETEVQPAIEQFKSSFSTKRGQDWAEAKAERLLTHFNTSTAADMSTLAGIQVHENYREAANLASNTAFQDPGKLPDIIQSLKDGASDLADSSPNLKNADRARIKTELTEAGIERAVKSGAIGAIAKSGDPEKTAADFTAKYPQYINGAEAQTLAQNARSQIRARDADAQRNEARAKAEARDVSSEVGEAYRVNIDSKDPRIKNDQAAQQVLNDPRLLPKDRANLIDYIKRQSKPETEVRISRETTVGLLREMRDPDADPDKLMQRAWDARLMDPGSKGSMTEADFNSFRKEMVDRKTPDGMALSQDRTEFFKKYDASIDGAMAMGEHSALGKQRMYQAQQDAARMEADLKRQGKDPHQIYNPASPNFFGKPENLSKYAVSFQDAQKYDRDIGKVAAPATPGASPAKGISTAPVIGDVMRGYRFKGGDPSDRGNWEKAK